MKIDYVSDLHFNHWMKWTVNQLKWEKRTRELTKRLIENGNGEVLVIAGDFGEWNCQALWILEEASKQYERVYFTYGNHDLYLLSKRIRRKYGDSLGRLDDLIKEASKIKNVVPLVKSVDVYKGKVFAGDVMWYLPENPQDWEFYNEESNDSAYIKINGYDKEDAVRHMWEESTNWYTSIKRIGVDVFVSHVPPIHNPYSPFEPNTCYMVNLPFINAKNWIFGHDHFQNSFKRNGVNFHINAIGYPSEYDKIGKVNLVPQYEVDTYKSFELKTFEI